MAPNNSTMSTIKKTYSKYWQRSPKEPVSSYKYCQEPVPGLYTCDLENNCRHLIYVKGNHRDYEHIFKEPKHTVPHTLEDNQEIKFQDLERLSSNSSFSKSCCNGICTACREETETDRCTSISTGASTPYTAISSSRSTTSISTMSSARSVTFSLPTEQPGTHFYESANTSFSSIACKTINTPPVKFVTPTTPSKPKRSTTSSQTNTSRGHILECDTAGYRPLATPLKVEYNTIAQRWMFTSEIKLRTRIARVHEGVYAPPKMHMWAPKKEFFVLDDGQTCVVKANIIEGRYHEKKVKKNAKLYGEDGFGGMIKLTAGETEESRARVERYKGRHLMSWKKQSDHAPVVRYLGLY